MSGPVPADPVRGARPSSSPTTPPQTSRLDHEISALVRQGVLTREEAAALQGAARSDLAASSVTPDRSGRGLVLEVLGYVGGALLLGALIFLGATFWDDLSRTGRTVVALGALLFSAGGGALLVTLRTRRTLGLVLLALASAAAGFAYFTLTSDDHLVVSSAVVVVTSLVGLVLTRSAAFAVSGWCGSVMFVFMLVLNELEVTDPGSAAIRLAVGFALVALAFVAAGLRVDRTLAWSLAGLAGWASALAILFENPRGDVLCLLVATVVAAALFTAFVRVRRYPLAVIGCLVLLSLWPTALYQIVDSAVGVAVGLIAAGGVLIAVVVVLSRHRPGVSATA